LKQVVVLFTGQRTSTSIKKDGLTRQQVNWRG